MGLIKPAILLVTAACLALAGCGGGNDEEDEARAVVEDFVEAGNERDFGRFCELLTADARQAIESFGEAAAEGDEQPTCEEALSGQIGDDPGEAEVSVNEVRIEGERAEADVSIEAPEGEPAQQTVELEREGDEWRVRPPELVEPAEPAEP